MRLRPPGDAGAVPGMRARPRRSAAAGAEECPMIKEEGEEVSEERPVVDYAGPEKREPLAATFIDWALRIIVWAIYGVAVVVGLIILWTCANYLLLTLFP